MSMTTSIFESDRSHHVCPGECVHAHTRIREARACARSRVAFPPARARAQARRRAHRPESAGRNPSRVPAPSPVAASARQAPSLLQRARGAVAAVSGALSTLAEAGLPVHNVMFHTLMYIALTNKYGYRSFDMRFVFEYCMFRVFSDSCSPDTLGSQQP